MSEHESCTSTGCGLLVIGAVIWIGMVLVDTEGSLGLPGKVTFWIVAVVAAIIGIFIWWSLKD